MTSIVELPLPSGVVIGDSELEMPWEQQYLEIVLRNNDVELIEKLKNDDDMRWHLEYLDTWENILKVLKNV